MIASAAGALCSTAVPAVVIALVYVWIPFAALPIYAALQSHRAGAARIGRRPAARGHAPSFWAVTFPLSRTGVLASFFMVFIPTVGEYVTPMLIGGSRGSMYGNIIQDFFTKAANWPRGAALSIVMLAVTLVLVAIAAQDRQRAQARRLIALPQACRVAPRAHLLQLYFAGLTLLLYVPLAVLLLFSFNAGTSAVVSGAGADAAHGISGLFDSPEVLRTARNSLIVGVGSATGATCLGTAVAVLLTRFQFRSQPLLFTLVMLPLIVPVVVLAVALLVLFLVGGIDRSLGTVAIGHTVLALPYVVLIVVARLSDFDRDLGGRG